MTSLTDLRTYRKRRVGFILDVFTSIHNRAIRILFIFCSKFAPATYHCLSREIFAKSNEPICTVPTLRPEILYHTTSQRVLKLSEYSIRTKYCNLRQAAHFFTRLTSQQRSPIDPRSLSSSVAVSSGRPTSLAGELLG